MLPFKRVLLAWVGLVPTLGILGGACGTPEDGPKAVRKSLPPRALKTGALVLTRTPSSWLEGEKLDLANVSDLTRVEKLSGLAPSVAAKLWEGDDESAELGLLPLEIQIVPEGPVYTVVEYAQDARFPGCEEPQDCVVLYQADEALKKIDKYFELTFLQRVVELVPEEKKNRPLLDDWFSKLMGDRAALDGYTSLLAAIAMADSSSEATSLLDAELTGFKQSGTSQRDATTECFEQEQTTLGELAGFVFVKDGFEAQAALAADVTDETFRSALGEVFLRPDKRSLGSAVEVQNIALFERFGFAEGSRVGLLHERQTLVLTVAEGARVWATYDAATPGALPVGMAIASEVWELDAADRPGQEGKRYLEVSAAVRQPLEQSLAPLVSCVVERVWGNANTNNCASKMPCGFQVTVDGEYDNVWRDRLRVRYLNEGWSFTELEMDAEAGATLRFTHPSC